MNGSYTVEERLHRIKRGLALVIAATRGSVDKDGPAGIEALHDAIGEAAYDAGVDVAALIEELPADVQNIEIGEA